MYSRYTPDANGNYRRHPIVAATQQSPQQSTVEPPVGSKALPDSPLEPVRCADAGLQHPRQWLQRLLPGGMETADLLILLLLLLVMIEDDDDLLTILLTAGVFFFL